jgi:hypothetical protein
VGDLVKRLFVRDIAQRTGLSLSAARALMVRLERKHGTAVVRRDGRRMYTDESALAAVWKGDRPASDLSRELEVLKARLRAHGRQLRALACALAALRENGAVPALQTEGIDHD